MPIPSHASLNFKTLVDVCREAPAPFPHLKPVAVAHWALQSAWGKTGLAARHLNFCALPWWTGAGNYGSPFTYADKRRYIHFTNLGLFVEAYWARFDEVALFHGWREHASVRHSFLHFIMPPHLSGRESWSTDCGHEPKAYLTKTERSEVRDVMSALEIWTHDLF